MDTNLELKTTPNFDDYIRKLKDPLGRAKIIARLKRLERGNWGDASPVGGGVTELRIHFGPGYRIYCKSIGNTVVIILGAGTKDQQQSDIDTAIEYAKTIQ
ncbi:type II toxin-antitoxin system RelE/ParE family toxin [Delftia deserti]|uniref:Type II toxin-antitoxin system RelE/ParE family toxin n=1 Tax=Delftia deserti TaxID=1651218 RepID=A0ABW5EV13_9BURK